MNPNENGSHFLIYDPSATEERYRVPGHNIPGTDNRCNNSGNGRVIYEKDLAISGSTSGDFKCQCGTIFTAIIL